MHTRRASHTGAVDTGRVAHRRNESLDGLFTSREDAARAVESMAEHIGRFIQAYERRSPQGRRPDTPESLYLVRRSDASITELLGFRLEGHPFALLGAFELPKHRRSGSRDGRASLSHFFSNPPRSVSVGGARVAPGLVGVELPRTGEAIPGFLERLRASEERELVHLDSSFIRFAFDLRFENPSEIPQFNARQRETERTMFRTVDGHVFSGVTYGLHETLHKDARYITVTDVWQYRGDRATPLPTLHVHREFLSLVRTFEDADDHQPFAAPSLAFHPSTASARGLLGFELPEWE